MEPTHIKYEIITLYYTHHTMLVITAQLQQPTGDYATDDEWRGLSRRHSCVLITQKLSTEAQRMKPSFSR